MAHLDLFLGGPDQPAGRLRDLLSERVGAVPPGGSIDWVTYYLRDRRLARELVRARNRGVAVNMTLERQPRTANPGTQPYVSKKLQAVFNEPMVVGNKKHVLTASVGIAARPSSISATSTTPEIGSAYSD